MTAIMVSGDRLGSHPGGVIVAVSVTLKRDVAPPDPTPTSAWGNDCLESVAAPFA